MEFARPAQDQKLILGHRHLEGMAVLVAPAGQKTVDPDRVDDGA